MPLRLCMWLPVTYDKRRNALRLNHNSVHVWALIFTCIWIDPSHSRLHQTIDGHGLQRITDVPEATWLQPCSSLWRPLWACVLANEITPTCYMTNNNFSALLFNDWCAEFAPGKYICVWSWNPSSCKTMGGLLCIVDFLVANGLVYFSCQLHSSTYPIPCILEKLWCIAPLPSQNASNWWYISRRYYEAIPHVKTRFRRLFHQRFSTEI